MKNRENELNISPSQELKLYLNGDVVVWGEREGEKVDIYIIGEKIYFTYTSNNHKLLETYSLDKLEEVLRSLSIIEVVKERHPGRDLVERILEVMREKIKNREKCKIAIFQSKIGERSYQHICWKILEFTIKLGESIKLYFNLDKASPYLIREDLLIPLKVEQRTLHKNTILDEKCVEAKRKVEVKNNVETILEGTYEYIACEDPFDHQYHYVELVPKKSETIAFDLYKELWIYRIIEKGVDA